MSVGMELDGGVSRTHVAMVPAAEVKATLKAEAERPRCASTPCSPIKGYQILHMDANYLVGFTTGEELLQLAQHWSGEPPRTEAASESSSKPVDLAIHRSSRIFRGKSRYYQPYDIPAANGRRRRRMPSSSDGFLKSLAQGDSGKSLHAPLPLCLLKGKRAQSKSLDYLNLDRISMKESSETEVLQYQLQHLTLFTRNKT